MFPHATCMCTSHIDARNQKIYNENIIADNNYDIKDNEKIANKTVKTKTFIKRRQRVESSWIIYAPKSNTNAGYNNEELVGHGNQVSLFYFLNIRKSFIIIYLYYKLFFFFLYIYVI